MRSIRDIAEAALDYTDIDSEDLIEAASDRQLKSLAGVITGALQELHAKKPEAFRDRIGITLRAPETATAVVTAGSTTANVSAFGRDVRGMTFRYGGDLNQIAPAAEAPGSSFVLPWEGATGNAGITIYSDAALIGSSAFSVLGDVHLEGYGPLTPAPDRATYTAFRDEMFGVDYGQNAPAMGRLSRNSGLPQCWWTQIAHLAGVQQLYLRVAPLPVIEVQLSFDLAYTPRELTADDLESEESLPFPGNFYDSVVIPVVLQRWTGSPWWRNTEARPEIARQFKVAMGTLEDWSPQVQSGSNIVVAIR